MVRVPGSREAVVRGSERAEGVDGVGAYVDRGGGGGQRGEPVTQWPGIAVEEAGDRRGVGGERAP